MLLSDVGEEHIGKVVTIERKFGEFIGQVAWVDRKQYVTVNTQKYLVEKFSSRGAYTEHIDYDGQPDYYHKVTEVKVGFFGDETLQVTLKEDYAVSKN